MNKRHKFIFLTPLIHIISGNTCALINKSLVFFLPCLMQGINAVCIVNINYITVEEFFRLFTAYQWETPLFNQSTILLSVSATWFGEEINHLSE
jgi:hypothetical protein